MFILLLIAVLQLIYFGQADKQSVRWVVGGHGALTFLALCKVGFRVLLCVPCNVLKIAWGSVGEVLGCVKLVTLCPVG